MLKYTLCFIRYDNQILMLLRTNQPNANCYNGVGGKIEPGETPFQGVLREVREETGITLKTARFGGTVTWGTGHAGMYVYLADLPADADPMTLQHKDTDEGPLEWLPEEYVLSMDEDSAVVDNIPEFLGPMLKGEPPREYRCRYLEWSLQQVSQHDLPADVVALATQETVTA